MLQVLDILKTSPKSTFEVGMDLLYEKEQKIPDSLQYNIKRYYSHNEWEADDTGMLVYHFNKI